MRQGAWRPQLVERIGTGDVVDVGCGTGEFAIPLAQAGARVIGIDGDEQILERARAKAGDERIDWRVGLADALPVEDGSADAVVCSLLLHHLQPEAKAATIAECHRVLRPGGRLHVADWGPPADPLQRVAFLGLQVLDGFSNTADHVSGLLPDLIAESGFDDVERWKRLRTVWGTLELISAVRRTRSRRAARAPRPR